MPLVSYSDSDEDDDLSANTSAVESPSEQAEKSKKAAPPTLPTNFHTLYASNTRSSTSDDPALHGGRQRQIPHVVGNWPSFIYLEWLPSVADLNSLDTIINDAASQLQGLPTTPESMLHSSLRSDLGVRLPLHVSLSAPLMLTTETKDEFARSVTAAIQNSHIRPFHVKPAGLKWVHNFDQTRWFLIMTLQRPENNELQTLLTTCNQVAKTFAQPQLYVNASSGSVGVQSCSSMKEDEVGVTRSRLEDHDKFHVSIAWTLTEPTCKSLPIELLATHRKELSMDFERIHSKIGNQISTIAFLNSDPRS